MLPAPIVMPLAALVADSAGFVSLLIALMLGSSLLAAFFTRGLLRRDLARSAGPAFQRVVDHDPDGVVIADLGGRVVYANSSARRWLALEGDLFAEFGDLLLEDGNRTPTRADIVDRLSVGDDGERGFVVQHSGGAWLYFEVFDISTRVDEERGQFSLRIRDITDGRRSREAQRESEARFRLLIESAPLGILATGLDGRATIVNRAFKEMVDADETDGIEPFSGKAGPAPTTEPRDPQLLELLQRCLDETEPFTDDVVLHREDREDRELRVHLNPLRGAQEGVSGVLLLAEDMTERRRGERAHRELERRMQNHQRLESIGVLAGGIAHDFNNLLTPILGHAALAGRHLKPGSPVTVHLEKIDSVARHAADLVAQLLAYAGHKETTLQSVDCAELAHEMDKLLPSVVGDTVPLRLRLQDQLPKVTGDRSQLQQVLMNLLINAAQAQEGHPGEVELEIGVRDVTREEIDSWAFGQEGLPGRWVYIQVSDHGVGMDEETKARILEPFFTTKETGRGLGLAVTLGVIRSHQGGLEIDSRPGRGSVFRVYMPVEADVSAVSTALPEIAANDMKQIPGESLQVLVVDDEDGVREIARLALETGGFRVATAADGSEALRQLDELGDSVSVVLLDASMPGMLGSEVLQRLRVDRPELPVVVMSGYSEDSSLFRDGRDPFTDFLPKPFGPSELIAAVNNAAQGEPRMRAESA